MNAGLYLAVWAVVATFFSSQAWLSALYSGRGTSFVDVIRYPLTDAVLWAALGLGAIALARGFPFEQGRIARAFLLHVPAALVLSLLEGALSFAVFQQLGLFVGHALPPARLGGLLVVSKLHANILTYAAIVGVVHLVAYQRKVRDRELQSSRLEAKLARAELEVLKMQIHPHFLFNTLHAISTLMHRDVEAADRMLSRLGDLLRMAMEDVGAQEVTLQHEMEFLGRYLEIEQTRFADRLRVVLRIAPEVLDALVPSLVLQPLVENAIRHGVAPRSGGGSVEIAAAREGDTLRLEVRDDGPGIPAGAPPRTGVGIANTRARLEQLYGRAHRFEMTNQPEGGLAILLVVPFRSDAGRAVP